MKKFFVSLLAVFVLSSVSSAEVFNITYIKEGSAKLRTTDKESGKLLWQSTVKVQKIKYQGMPFVYIREQGAGIYGKDKQYQTWLAEAYMSQNASQLIPYQAKIVFKDKSGNILRTIENDYDRSANKVTSTINQNQQKTFDFDQDLIDKQDLAVVFPNYPFAEKRDSSCHLLTGEPTRYKMDLKYLGEETVAVDGKQIACYKIQMIPDLGAMNLLGAFVPKTYFWYKVLPPHEFVRYEGLESGLGTPYVIMETVE